MKVSLGESGNPQLSNGRGAWFSSGLYGARRIHLVFKFRKTRFQALIFGARLCRHRLYRLEFLTRHEIHIGYQLLEALTHEGVDLGADAVRSTGRVGEELGKAVEDGIFGLHAGYMAVW